jgi:hypothetical protein
VGVQCPSDVGLRSAVRSELAGLRVRECRRPAMVVFIYVSVLVALQVGRRAGSRPREGLVPQRRPVGRRASKRMGERETTRGLCEWPTKSVGNRKSFHFFVYLVPSRFRIFSFDLRVRKVAV